MFLSDDVSESMTTIFVKTTSEIQARDYNQRLPRASSECLNEPSLSGSMNAVLIKQESVHLSDRRVHRYGVLHPKELPPASPERVSNPFASLSANTTVQRQARSTFGVSCASRPSLTFSKIVRSKRKLS